MKPDIDIDVNIDVILILPRSPKSGKKGGFLSGNTVRVISVPWVYLAVQKFVLQECHYYKWPLNSKVHNENWKEQQGRVSMKDLCFVFNTFIAMTKSL